MNNGVFKTKQDRNELYKEICIGRVKTMKLRPVLSVSIRLVLFSAS